MSVLSAIRGCYTLDFETDKIEPRPKFPPRPVGLAVRHPDGHSEYLAWGHLSGNNCDLSDAVRLLEEVWRSGAPILFFNAKFDLHVAYEKLHLPQLPWDRVHDAQFLAFLANPHAKQLNLKELANYFLDWPAEERDRVSQWVWENRSELERISGQSVRRRQGKDEASNAGEFYSLCPVDLLAPYALGDVDRTHGLFEWLYPKILEHGMGEAYDRERQILPIFMENERDGMRVDLERLQSDLEVYERNLQDCDTILGDLLGDTGINLNSSDQLADALERKGIIDPNDWSYTPSGKRSTKKENLKYEMFKCPKTAMVYFYRGRLQTAVKNFLRPWEIQASQRGGIVSTNWNQCMGTGGGTRTGRPSTNDPNFLNIPKTFDDKYDVPENNEFGLKPLPFVRSYVLPDEGHTFIHRDFDGQEMRIFAEAAQGVLLREYQRDPNTDPHEWVQSAIFDITGEKLQRSPVKAVNFQGIYGGGVNALSGQLGITRQKAQEIRNFHGQALPDLDNLKDAIERVVRGGDPIRTWGGRTYHPEPPRWVKGERRTFNYKLINYFCQGSAADITKEAIIRWYNHPKRDARFLVTVYDEINISAYNPIAVEQNKVLKECMESIELDLLMTSSGKMGASWGQLKECY